jgi:hypothetical protein
MGTAPQNPSQNSPRLNIGDADYNVEFNDSVLSTQAWNNPRYDGSKTLTQRLNKYTSGDSTYGKTTAVQQYSRNIYVGKQVIGYLDDLYQDLAHNLPNTTDFNTGNYTGFPDWSYVIIEKFYTINEDDSIEQTQKFEETDNETSDALGRTFKNDFKIGTKCNIIDYSSDTINRLNTQYTVQFNKGLLGKIAEGVATRQDFNINVMTPSSGKEPNNFRFNPIDDVFHPQGFYIQPSSSFNQFWVDVSGSGFTVTHASQSYQFFSMLSERETLYQDKYAIKFFSTSSADSLYVANEYGPESKLLFELSKISASGPVANKYLIRSKVKNINSIPLQTANSNPQAGYTSFIAEALDNNTNFVLYYINESNNVILVDLPRKRDLPQGITDFIVLPENIHPYIKDNIDYFVNEIGVTNSNQTFTINPRNRQLS